MKKKTLLAVTALTLACLGSQSLTAMAAPKNNTQIRGNKIYIYGSDCNQNLQSILDKLQNCIPNITLPDCDQPETDIPETEAPETNIPDSDLPETDSSNDHAYIKEVVDLVNIERAKEGLAPLTIDTKVQAAAQVRAQECEQRFSHTRPNGTSFSTALKEQNVSYRSAGENIAWGQKSPQEVVTTWMNSSGHRANIMNKNFTTIGVGYYENARGTDYWCQLFTR
ncbi:MAG: CAP domain-containing protein [Lachnospiraceae bacterium]|nr:CAP domain-containing protein [Lachnospiraceae bacterium]